MTRLIILSVITFVTVNTQFVPERRHDERENLRINSGELRVNRKYQEYQEHEGLRVNERTSEHGTVGGFQNGNFAQTDGRLRTNLNSGPIVSESSGQNFEPRDSLLVLEEGAAFRTPGNGKYDVHSNLGRNVGVSYAPTEDDDPNESRERIDQRTIHNQNSNGQFGSRQSGQHADEQGNTRTVKNYRNTQGNGNIDRITNFDQTTRQIGRNFDNNAQNERNNNQNTFNTQQISDQESINDYEGHTNSRQNGQNMNTQYDSINNGQNRFNNPHTQQTTESNKNRGLNTWNSGKPVTKVDTRSSSGANADKMINKQNKTSVDMDRELNNQITKMIFEESTQAGSVLNTKTTKDNELPSRSSSGKQDDKWIWSDGNQMKNGTTTPVPTVDDRAAFVGDQCPTGQVKFNNACVDVD